MLACAAALVVGLRTVSGLRWPYDGDHFRDIAQAQVTRDGHPLSDPHYAGELIWYNPLVPWVVGGGSAIARVTPAAFHVQAGPWLNVIAPIGFYLLGAQLAGRGAAFAALILFLFFNGRTEPALTTPTYSPWLFVATFAQGLFYLSLAGLAWAGRRNTDGAAALAGALAGITFLTHTAPAIVLGACALVLLPFRRLIVAGLVALVVASPFLYAIVWRYHLHVLNSAPMTWRWLPVTPGGMPDTLRANAVVIGLGIAGLVMVRSRVGMAWLGSAAALLGYALWVEGHPAWPALVPAFHFWRYTLAALILFSGAAIWWACERAARRYAPLLLAGGAVAAVVWMWPQYQSRFDLVYGQSIAADRDPNQAAVTAFLHSSTPADAVILGNRGASLQVIGPAGRRVVAVNANWSNPYLDNATRVRDRDAMLQALTEHRPDDFAARAAAYRVTHVVGVGPEECARIAWPPLQLMYTFGTLCVYVVK